MLSYVALPSSGLTTELAAYDYRCGALDKENNEVVDAYRNMLYVSHFWLHVLKNGALHDTDVRPCFSRGSVVHPSRALVLFYSLLYHLPDSLIRLADYLPTHEARRYRRSVTVINTLSTKLIKEKTQVCLDRKDENLRDIMSILGAYLYFLMREVQALD